MKYAVWSLVLSLTISAAPAFADCPPAPMASQDDMVLRFPVAQGVWVGSASFMADSVVNPATNVEGVVVYDIADKTLKLCDGDNWQPLSGTTGITNAAGNAGEIQFKGTDDDLSADAALAWDNVAKSLLIGEHNPLLPQNALVIDGGADATANRNSITVRRNGTNLAGPLIYLQKTRNGGQTLNEDGLGTIIGVGTAPDGSRIETAGIAFHASGDTTPTSQGGTILLRTKAQGTTTFQTRMAVTHDGNVGIGTTNPSGRLEISTEGAGEILRLTDTGNDNILGIGTDGNMLDFIRIRPRGSATGAAITGNNDTIGVFVSASNSYVGVRTASPSHVLHVNGVARSTQASFATSSDARVKTDIAPLENSLSLIAGLNPVRFEYTSEYQGSNKALSGQKRGFIAQEVEAVLPDMVSRVAETVGTRTIEDFRVLENSDFVPLLVKAVQELKAAHDELKAANDNLQSVVEAQRQEIEAIRKGR